MPSAIVTGAFCQSQFAASGTSHPCGPFAVGANLYLFAYSNYPNDPLTGLCVPGIPATIACYKSSDGGTTWAVVDGPGSQSAIYWDQTAVNSGGDPRYFICKRLANTVWVAYTSPVWVIDPAGHTSQFQVRIAAFDLITETWGVAVTDGPVYGSVGVADILDITFSPFCMDLSGAGDLYIAVGPYKADNGFQYAAYAKLAGGLGGAWGPWVEFPAQPVFPDPNWIGGTQVYDVWRSATDGSVHAWYIAGSNAPLANTDQHNYHFLLDNGAGVPGVAVVDMIPPFQVFSGPPVIMDNQGWTTRIGAVEYIGIVATANPFGSGSPNLVRIWYSTDQGATWASDPIPTQDGDLLMSSILDGTTRVDPATGALYVYSVASVTSFLDYVVWSGPGLVSPPATLIASAYIWDGTAWCNVVGPAYGEPFTAVDDVLYGAPPLGAPGDIGTIGLTFLGAGGAPPIPVVVVQGFGGGGGHKLYMPAPNQYDCCLWQEAQLFQRLQVNSWRCPMVRGRHGERIPVNGDEFFVSQSILTPGPGPDTLVVSFTPGPGQEGLLYGIRFWYTGTGFVPGSGDIIWRLQTGRVWGKGFGSVVLPMGANYDTWRLPDYIPIRQAQTFTIFVNVPNTSGLIQVGASQILCTLQGWTYPIL